MQKMKSKLLKRSIFYPQYDLDPQECVKCGRRNDEDGAIVTIDRLHIPWCEQCDHRRLALDWGERHNWPVQYVWNLDEEGEDRIWLISEGLYGWNRSILDGSDDLVWSFVTSLDAGIEGRQPFPVRLDIEKCENKQLKFLWS